MIPNNATFLVVEDDKQIRTFICHCLTGEGYKCLTAGTGRQTLDLLESEGIDVMLLDLGLPDMDGMDVIRRVRAFSALPILVVSARDQDSEKAAALDLGADDYLTKPFSATELMARARVALRHLIRASGQESAQIVTHAGALTIDPDRRVAIVEGREAHLTPLEMSLITLLLQNAGKVLTTRHIIREIYGAHYGTDTQALRALMAGLRRKIEENPAKPRYLLTEIGVGYRLADE